MRITHCFFPLLLIISALGGCGGPIPSDSSKESPRIRYFSSLPLRESPFPDLTGIVPLTTEQAKARNHYRFVYDELYRPTKVSFHLGDKSLRQPNHTANYFFTSPVQKIQYEEGKEIRTFYDIHGNQINQRGAFREVYLLNEQGERTDLYFENKLGERIENSWGIGSYNWEVQDDGAVIERRYSLSGKPKSLRPGFEFFTIRLRYDAHGWLALMENIDEEGKRVNNNSGVAQDKLLFDRQGRWHGWKVLDKDNQLARGNGPNVARGINIPDEWGYETSISYEDVDGTALRNSHGFWGSKRFYDSLGNYSHTYFIDSLGNPGLNDETGYSYARYSWDEMGLNRTKVDLLGVDERPILHKNRGYASIKQEYDEHHSLIKTSYLGLDGELINRKDNGVAYIEYRYDDQHSRTGAIWFDRDGKEINR